MDIEQDITNVSCSKIEPESFCEIDELDFSETDSEDNQPTDGDDDDFDTGLHNEDLNSSFSEEGELELDDLWAYTSWMMMSQLMMKARNHLKQKLVGPL